MWLSHEPSPNVVRLEITPEQWVGLLNQEGRWLEACCASVSEARDILGEVLRHNGQLDRADAENLFREIGRHDMIGAAFDPNHADAQRRDNFALAEGSPWPTIAEAVKVLLGDPLPPHHLNRPAR